MYGGLQGSEVVCAREVLAGFLYVDAAVFDGGRGCSYGVSTGTDHLEFGQLIVDIIVIAGYFIWICYL